MNLLGNRKRVTPARTTQAVARRVEYPDINAFVEIALNGSRLRESVPVNDITADALVTRKPSGVQTGDSADFVYTNDAGRFRFATTCTTVDRDAAAFALPAQIRTIESFANRRTAPRLPWLAPAHWRLARDGQGYGEFLPGSMMDISSGGMSIVVARRLQPGAQVEVRFKLDSEREPVVAVSLVVRATTVENSGKNAAGIRFLDFDERKRRVIGDFVNERQLARRERGVV